MVSHGILFLDGQPALLPFDWGDSVHGLGSIVKCGRLGVEIPDYAKNITVQKITGC